MTSKCPSCDKSLVKHSIVDLVNCGMNILNTGSDREEIVNKWKK